MKKFINEFGAFLAMMLAFAFGTALEYGAWMPESPESAMTVPQALGVGAAIFFGGICGGMLLFAGLILLVVVAASAETREEARIARAMGEEGIGVELFGN